MQASYYIQITETKVAKWGIPKPFFFSSCFIEMRENLIYLIRMQPLQYLSYVLSTVEAA
jgi:hypothetical protein